MKYFIPPRPKKESHPRHRRPGEPAVAPTIPRTVAYTRVAALEERIESLEAANRRLREELEQARWYVG